MTRIRQFFSNPLVGILGSLASLVGLAVSFYFYYASIKNPLFSYHVKPGRATIVKSSEASGLEINYSGKQIRGDISAAQIALWNAGKQPIKTEHILNKIQIITSGVPIIEARIQKSTRDVCGIALDKNELEKGILGVSWKILEDGDGGVVQIIYNGNTGNEIKCIGDIEGQKKFGNYSDSAKIESKQEYKRPSILAVLLMPLTGLTLLCGSFFSILIGNRLIHDQKKPNRLNSIVLPLAPAVFLVIYLTFKAMKVFNEFSMSPPFDY